MTIYSKFLNVSRSSRIFRLFLISLFVVSCSISSQQDQSSEIESPSPESSFTPSPGSLSTPTIESFAQDDQIPYGVVYPFTGGPWDEEDRLPIRTQMEFLKELGVNTVIQVFSSKDLEKGTEENWLIFLDEAYLADIKVIALLHPGGGWTDNGFDYPTIQAFLKVVDNHPALLAYLGLHEPLEDFTSAQLREYYLEVKKFSPDILIAHYMGNMAWFDRNLRYPGRKFTAGICDICITWYYPAGQENGSPIFDEIELRESFRENQNLIDDRAPEAQIWFLGQSFTLDTHKRRLRMPSPDEMEKMFLVVSDEGVDGFLWYPWSHGNYDQVLGDQEMEPQRQQVRYIFDQYIDQPSTH